MPRSRYSLDELSAVIRETVRLYVPKIAEDVQQRIEAGQAIVCPFCSIMKNKPGEVIAHTFGVMSFEPLNPVTKGHRLFVPGEHVEWDATEPVARRVGDCVRAAVLFAEEEAPIFNLITSCGAPATQTIAHVHVHLVPRRVDDGLTLPWTYQHHVEGADPPPMRGW